MRQLSFKIDHENVHLTSHNGIQSHLLGQQDFLCIVRMLWSGTDGNRITDAAGGF